MPNYVEGMKKELASFFHVEQKNSRVYEEMQVRRQGLWSNVNDENYSWNGRWVDDAFGYTPAPYTPALKSDSERLAELGLDNPNDFEYTLLNGVGNDTKGAAFMGRLPKTNPQFWLNRDFSWEDAHIYAEAAAKGNWVPSTADNKPRKKEAASVDLSAIQNKLDSWIETQNAELRTYKAKNDSTLQNTLSDFVTTAQELRDLVGTTRTHTLTIKTERNVVELGGKQHEKFDVLLKVLSTTFPVMLVGSAGTGKTFAAKEAATAFGLDYYAISVGSQTTKSDLLGYRTADGNYVTTAFRQAYENGGIFLMDEIDAGNANVLIVLNSALASGHCAFADKMVDRHKDFYFVGTANTFGSGANRQYVGRNQIDAATLDRFITIEWNVDETLESHLIANYGMIGERWHRVVKGVRAYVNNNNLRVVVSPRATMKGAALLDLGFDIRDVLNMTLLHPLDNQQGSVLYSVAMENW